MTCALDISHVFFRYDEFKMGDELHRDSGKWVYREMNVNREEDIYEEIVKDKESGKEIHPVP